MIFYDWDDKRWKGKKGSQLFEELCERLLKSMGYKGVNWLKGSYDEGRDIICHTEFIQPDKTILKEDWICGCKYSKKSLNKNKFRNEIDWADARRPNYLLIITQSYLTPPTKKWIEELNSKQDKKYEIRYWERSTLEDLIEEHQAKFDMLKFFPRKGVEQLIQTIREENIKSDEKYYALVQRAKLQLAKLDFEKHLDKISEKYEYLANLAENSNKPFQASDFLYNALRIVEKKGNKKRIFKIRQKLGELHLLKDWESAAQNEFEKALNLAQELGDKKYIAEINLWLGKSYHYGSIYDSAKDHYEKARTLFYEIGSMDNVIHSNLSLAKLSLDLDMNQDYMLHIKNLESIITKKIRIKDKEIIIELFLTLAMLYSHKRLWDKANESIYNAKRKYTRAKLNKKRILLRLLFEEAFLLYQQDQSDKAIQVLEGECIELASHLQDEEGIVLALKQASFVRMFRNKPSFGSTEDWESQSRANDIRRKFESEYDRAERVESYAGWELVNQKYRDTLISLNKSKRAYSNLGDFVNILSVKRELSTLNEQAGRLIDALDYSIDIGESDRIKRICSQIAVNSSTEEIRSIFDMLLELQNLSVVQRVGLAATFEALGIIVPDYYVEKVTAKLIVLTKDQLSFVSNYDVRRTALKALQSYSEKIDGHVLEELIQRICELVTPDNHWDVRRESLIVCRGFYRKLPANLQDILANRFELLLTNINEGDHIIHDVIIVAANLSQVFDSPWKEKLIEVLKKKWAQKLTMEGIRILTKLGVIIPEETIRKAITHMLEIIGNQVIVEDKPITSDNTPSMPGSAFIQTTPLGPNKRVVVGGGYDFSVFGALAENIPNDLRESVIRTFLDQIKNEHNVIINKQSMIAELSNLKKVIPSYYLSEVVDLLCAIAEGRIYISEKQKEQLEENKNPFASGNINFGKPEDLIGAAIEILGELMDIANSEQKIKIVQILIKQSRSDLKHARNAVAYSLRYLESWGTSEKLALFSLLNDSELDVVAVATPTFGLVCDRISDKEFNEFVIEKICYQIIINHSYLRFTSVTAFGEFLKKSSIDPEIKEKIKECLSSLTSDKFYRVRHHARLSLAAINI